MKDQDKAKEQLINELGELRQRIAELKASEAEREQAEEALQESEKQLRQLAENIREVFWIVSPDWNQVIYISPAYEEVWGRSCESLYEQSRSWLDGVVEEDREKVLVDINRKAAGDLSDPEFPEYRIVRPDGSVRWISARAFPVWDEQGEVYRITGIAEDITERKRAEEVQEKLAYDLGERLKKLNCLYGISHLVETPDISLEEILQETVELIPPAWQYPEVTCARIRLEGQEFRTENWTETTWKQTADIFVHGEQRGSVEVGYLEERSGSDEGPFLKEERSLVNAIAERLGRITERKRVEDALRSLLEETARGQRLLLALSQASQAVQRARTPEEVYQTIGDEIAGLGYHATIFTLTDDRTHLTASYMTFKPALLRTAEKLTGLSAQNYRFPLEAGGFYERIIEQGKAVFSDPGAGLIAEALPRSARWLTKQLADVLGIEKVIYAPLKVGGEAHSIMTVIGADLTEADVPAVMAFASQAEIAIENAELYLATQEELAARKRAEASLRESEERFRQMAENTRDVFWMRDLKSLDLIYLTPTFERLWGQSIEEAYKETRSWLENVHPQDRDRIATAFEKQIQGEPTENEYRIVWPDGSIHWIRDRVFPIYDEAGEAYRLVGVVEDVTERKQAEEERERLLVQIRGQAQRMQHILDTVPEGVLLLDADERIILVNPVAERDLVVLTDAKTGDTLTHLGNRPLAELLTSPPRGLWHEVVADGWVFQAIARPIEDGPTPIGWVVVIRDVTRQREIEQRVQQQERLAAVGQLAAGIAHDFNNIMAAIVLYAQMTARMEGLPSIIRERMETIDEQAKHATNLIQQILDFSRRAVLERRPLDLALLLKEHVRLLERTLPESVEIKLDYEPDEYATPFTVNADPTRMHQMVMNLAVNARDAMPKGGILRIGLERIEVRPGESPLLPEMEPGEWVRMTVSDTGTGIPPNVLPHIFEPFFTTKKVGLGSGLGLPQVHGIVAQHEGRIDVETQVGKGTTFTIYLPVYLSEPLPVLSSTELSALPTGQGETILVVEDDAVVQKALVNSLELLNYQVRKASNGQEALAVLEGHKGEIALVLSDVVMPQMGGIALLHALKEQGLTVPVVMLTGHAVQREMEELRAQGIRDWLPKPPQLEQLAKVVARILSTD
jgi:two-component system cell cycle sensor histidine kinase/response regulator CckA